MNRFFGFILCSAVTATFLSSCGGDDNSKDHSTSEAKGGIYLGGIARLNEVENVKSLIPFAMNDVVSYHLGAQVYEGLVKYNQTDLSLIPGLATRWEISEDQTQYTFHLRAGVKFHDDPCFADGKGRIVTATDFKYCFAGLRGFKRSICTFNFIFKSHIK